MKKEKPSEFSDATPEALAKARLGPIRRKPQLKPDGRTEAAEEADR